MSNVLDDEKQQQIRALGRLGWTLSRIEDATGTRRFSQKRVPEWQKAYNRSGRGSS